MITLTSEGKELIGLCRVLRFMLITVKFNLVGEALSICVSSIKRVLITVAFIVLDGTSA